MVIESVTLLADDIHSLHDFYGKRLGLPAALNPATGELVITIGASELLFRHEPGFAGVYHVALNIPENRLTECQAFLEQCNVALIADAGGEAVFDFDFWDAHTLYFRDPAGNIGECIARHELANASSRAEAFSSKELLSISEVGFACTDAVAVAERLKAVCGIGEYRETSPTFIPLGDANGLFILVPVGRIWFPNTGIAAHPYPQRVIVRNARGERFAVSWDNRTRPAAEYDTQIISNVAAVE